MIVAGTPQTEPEAFVSASHWFPVATRPVSQYARGFLWAPEKYTSAVSIELGALKSGQRLVDRSGYGWRRFELPHGLADDLMGAEILLTSTTDSSRVRVEKRSSLPSRKLLEEVAFLQSQGEDDEAIDLLEKSGFSEDSVSGISVLNLIDRHADLMYRLCRSRRSIGPYREYEASGNSVRPILRICKRWDRIGRSRTPPLSLIVRLAADLPQTIEEICNSPRVVLRRERELEQAARIREVDQSCIRWLGRQPGRSLIEKAGSRQRLMAVVRKEDCDTPENRVVRDLLVRCRTAGRSYLARNTNFRTHERFKSVQKLVTLCEKHLKYSQLASVRQLVGTAQPNYVLQHESRYRVLWDAYLRLVKQEQVTQSVWQWRDRVWLEWLTLGLASALTNCSLRSPAHRQGVGICPEPSTGEFIDDSIFGPWWPSVGSVDSVYLVNAAEIERSPIADWVKNLLPDAVLVSSKRNTAIWTVLDPVHPKQTAEEISARLTEETAGQRHGDCQLLVLVGGGKKIQQGASSDRVRWACLPLMLQDSPETWRGIVSECLQDA